MARRFPDCEPLERCVLLNALQYPAKRPRDEVIRWCRERWGSEPQYCRRGCQEVVPDRIRGGRGANLVGTPLEARRALVVEERQ